MTLRRSHRHVDGTRMTSTGLWSRLSIIGLTAVATAFVLTLPLALEPMAPAQASESETPSVVKACFIQPLPYRSDLPDPDFWCHPLFASVDVEQVGDGLRVSWEPLSTQVYWPCGEGGVWQNCPITEYRASMYAFTGPGATPVDSWQKDEHQCSVSPPTSACDFPSLIGGKLYLINLWAEATKGHLNDEPWQCRLCI